MSDRILVKISVQQDKIMIRTITRERKSPAAFSLLRSDVRRLWKKRDIVLRDRFSSARVLYDEVTCVLHIQFHWLQASGIDGLNGWDQNVYLSYLKLLPFIRSVQASPEAQEWHGLSIEERFPRLVFMSRKNLYAALTNKIVRRKLLRFLQDNFKWIGSDQIVLYDDWMPYSFSFQEVRRHKPGICGGVILHDQQDLSKAHYSIHT